MISDGFDIHPNGPEANGVRKRHAAESLRIAKRYRKLLVDAENMPVSVGARLVRRKPVPPRYRPDSVLKREIYQLACEIEVGREIKVLIDHVKKRDAEWDFTQRPRGTPVIEWTIRLVRGRLKSKPPPLGVRTRSWLFNDDTQTRMSTELNFAFSYGIRPDFVTMFVDEFGGHEIIKAKVAAGEYDLSGEDWLYQIQRSGYGQRNRSLSCNEISVEEEEWEEDEDEPASNQPLLSSEDDSDSSEWDDDD